MPILTDWLLKKPPPSNKGPIMYDPLRPERRREKEIDFNFITFVVISLFFIFFFLSHMQAFGKEVCTVKLDDKTVARVPISTRGTVISFPLKPTKVILGRSGTFGIEYVEADLAISPLGVQSQSHLFTYLLGRRFTFNLVTVLADGCTLVLVRDALETPGKSNQRGK